VHHSCLLFLLRSTCLLTFWSAERERSTLPAAPKMLLIFATPVFRPPLVFSRLSPLFSPLLRPDFQAAGLDQAIPPVPCRMKLLSGALQHPFGHDFTLCKCSFFASSLCASPINIFFDVVSSFKSSLCSQSYDYVCEAPPHRASYESSTSPCARFPI